MKQVFCKLSGTYFLKTMLVSVCACLSLWTSTIANATILRSQVFPLDSLMKEPHDSSVIHKIKPVFSLDFRNSTFDYQPVSIWGFNAGIAYGPKEHHVTLGYYWLGYFAEKRLSNLRKNEAIQADASYYNKNDFWFVSLIYWRNILFSERWIVSIPLEVGGGMVNVMPHDVRTDHAIGRSHRDFFVPAQAGVYGQWKATRWIGLSAQIGYRYAVFHTDVKQHFTGIYYSVGAVAYPELFHWVWNRVIHKKKKVYY
ncbi:hypothetical protein QNI16_05425 [Cytophagaceae bacterium YF14B1]|uniref:DUF3575 domain-containing protein n=1 Tax=Xanthocytophaga flava TaxID=3048013 RepID=A0AAE3QIE5_9BACT|nr:hypothetical protein [Xanthocytophaga flavus]MDJ1479917.1 hypothetical protein [Xanthocytophaga flavus]